MTTAAPPEIFKAYDIRGLYGDQIDGDVAELIGRAFARVIGELSGKAVSDVRLGLGRDMRLTAPELAGRYRDGMTSEGASAQPLAFSTARLSTSTAANRSSSCEQPHRRPDAPLADTDKGTDPCAENSPRRTPSTSASPALWDSRRSARWWTDHCGTESPTCSRSVCPRVSRWR